MTSVSLLSSFVLVLVVLFVGPAATQAQTASGYMCIIFYSNPGDINFPWSSATSVEFTYSTTNVTNTFGTAVTILSGNGQRIYTDQYGANVLTTPFTVAPASTDPSTAPDNLLYLGSSVPVDELGLTWQFSSPIELPGVGPTGLVSSLNIISSSGVLVEGASQRIDSNGIAFESNVPGFTNLTIGAVDQNSLNVLYSACQAPLIPSFVNTPPHMSNENSAIEFTYDYFISDGSTYSVWTNLTLTASSAFPTADELGDFYQTITDITGTRTYTYLLDGGCQINSVVSGISSSTDTAAGNAPSQSWYPYTYLYSAPGLYTTNNVPYLDGEGLGFAVSPSVPSNGNAAGCSGDILYATVNVLVQASQSNVVLTEGGNAPLFSLEQQVYTL